MKVIYLFIYFTLMLDDPPLNSTRLLTDSTLYVRVHACMCEYSLHVIFLFIKISWTDWHGLFCLVKAAIWHGQKLHFSTLLSTINSTIATKAFTLSAVLIPLYISNASILSEVLLHISMLWYISAISLNTSLFLIQIYFCFSWTVICSLLLLWNIYTSIVES